MNKFLLLAVAAFTFAVAAPAMAHNHGHEDMTKEEKAVATEEKAMDEGMETEVCHDEEGEEVECPEVMEGDADDEMAAETGDSYTDDAEHDHSDADHSDESMDEEY